MSIFQEDEDVRKEDRLVSDKSVFGGFLKGEESRDFSCEGEES